MRHLAIGRFALPVVAAAVSVVLAGAASAGTVWRHGVIEPKSDAGLVMMAAKRGFGDRQGISIEVLPIKSDALGLRALISGEIDSYEGAPGNAIVAGAKGSDVRIIGCAWPQLVHGIFVRSDVADLKGLAGKSFAVSAPGAMPDLLARAALQEHGVDPASVRFANLGGDLDRYKALSAGVVQAAIISSEYLPVADKSMKMLYPAREIMPNFVRGCVMTTAREIANRPDDVAKFMAAEIGGLRYAAAHKDEALALTREITQAKPDDPRPSFIFDEVVKHGDLDTEMNVPVAKLDWLKGLLVTTSGIPESTDVSKMVDTSVRERALGMAAKS